MNKHPWTAFYWNDYLSDTAELTFEQHGAYLMLLAHYYSTGGPISANASRLHKACRCTSRADQAAVAYVLEKFFEREGDLWKSSRADQEIEKREDISEKRRDAANKKHAKLTANYSAKRMQEQVHLHTQSQSHTKTPLIPLAGGNKIPSRKRDTRLIDQEVRRLVRLHDPNIPLAEVVRSAARNLGFDPEFVKYDGGKDCLLHVNCGLTPDGGCYGCYSDQEAVHA